MGWLPFGTGYGAGPGIIMPGALPTAGGIGPGWWGCMPFWEGYGRAACCP